MLDVAESDLEIEGDRIQATGMREKSASFGEIARTVAGTAGYALPAGITPGLEATEHLVIDDMAHANGTAVVEVEVDAETGAVEILKFIALHDCGRIINPMLVDGQILGGTAHGIGNALFEWMGYDDNAQPVTTNLGEYLLVTATEMPHIEILHHESPTPLNPLGSRGRRMRLIPVAAAIISAIEDALTPFGVHLAQAPISPAQIVALIEEGANVRREPDEVTHVSERFIETRVRGNPGCDDGVSQRNRIRAGDPSRGSCLRRAEALISWGVWSRKNYPRRWASRLSWKIAAVEAE